MRLAALTAFLLLAGCQQDGKTAADAAKEAYARRNPSGRFQMVAKSLNGVGVTGVFILDTRDGSLIYCQPHPQAPTTLQAECSASTAAQGAEF